MNDLKKLFDQLKSGDDAAYDIIFRQSYSTLCRTANQLLADRSLAEDVVQEFFIYLWGKRRDIIIDSNPLGYLKRAVINRSINQLNSKKGKTEEINESKTPISTPADNTLERQDHKRAIDFCVDQLPTKRRQVFILYRFEELKYKEIAALLKISVKTVEAQLRQARMALQLCLKTRLELKNI